MQIVIAIMRMQISGYNTSKHTPCLLMPDNVSASVEYSTMPVYLGRL